jgi:hypothetical protein
VHVLRALRLQRPITSASPTPTGEANYNCSRTKITQSSRKPNRNSLAHRRFKGRTSYAGAKIIFIGAFRKAVQLIDASAESGILGTFSCMELVAGLATVVTHHRGTLQVPALHLRSCFTYPSTMV